MLLSKHIHESPLEEAVECVTGLVMARPHPDRALAGAADADPGARGRGHDLVLGGDHLLVAGIGVSFDAVGVTGTISLAGGLADVALGLMGRMMIAAIEMAMPALAALFIAEVVLGIAARFAPQSNVFLIGLPVKLFAALASIGAYSRCPPELLPAPPGSCTL